MTVTHRMSHEADCIFPEGMEVMEDILPGVLHNGCLNGNKAQKKIRDELAELDGYQASDAEKALNDDTALTELKDH